MIQRVPITIRLDHFEGPLDLLLFLIHSHELDITKVSISHITDQYLSYIRLMQELDFEMAAEFLLMAATLVLWKSKSLLPQENVAENAEDLEPILTQEDLIRQLLDHQRFLGAGAELARLPLLGIELFTRPNHRPPIERIWPEMNISSLALSYQDQIVRERSRSKVLRKETVSLTDKIRQFGSRLLVGKLTALTDLLGSQERPEVVVTFLASLELARLKKLRVYQEVTYEPIYVELLDAISDLNFQLVQTFENLENRTETSEPITLSEPVSTEVTV